MPAAGTVLGKRTREPLKQKIEPVTPNKRRVIQLQTPEKTPTKNAKCQIGSSSPYSPAKSVLRRSAAAKIVGRERELAKLERFVESSRDGLLYICGPPGTGKSATVAHSMVKYESSKSINSNAARFKVVNINCFSLKKPEQVYEHILFELECIGTKLAALKDRIEVLDNQGIQIILVLDEVDYLTSGSSKVLYSLFEMGASKQLKIIAIANALNLTDALLPHLRATGLEPLVLRFKPYTPAEITSILSSRISEIKSPCGTSRIVDQSALDFIGRKVANATGDIRKALDILRKSVETVESEYRSALSTLSPNTASNSSPTPPKLTTVSIKHIAKVASQALGGSSSAATLANLPVHEKAVLCTIVARKTNTIAATYEAYVSLCKRDKMLSPLSRSEFSTVASSMLDNGILTFPASTSPSFSTTSTSSTSSASAQTRRSAAATMTTGTAAASQRNKAITSRMTKQSGATREEDRRIVLGVSEMDVLNSIGDLGLLKRFFD